MLSQTRRLPVTVIAVKLIHTKANHRAALRRVEKLMGAKPGTGGGDELDVLVDLVEAYERRHCALPRAGGTEVLRHLLESNGLTQSDIPEVGTQASIILVLSGKRQLTLRQIKALSVRFHVGASSFI
jgi:HTH-type transcriptional regulator / antitoxin HigA